MIWTTWTAVHRDYSLGRSDSGPRKLNMQHVISEMWWLDSLLLGLSRSEIKFGRNPCLGEIEASRRFKAHLNWKCRATSETVWSWLQRASWQTRTQRFISVKSPSASHSFAAGTTTLADPREPNKTRQETSAQLERSPGHMLAASTYIKTCTRRAKCPTKAPAR